MTKKDTIYLSIRRSIIKGEYTEHQLIPSESELCDFFEVSREPVRRALKQLKVKGYINSKHGKGYYVNPKAFYINNTLLSSSDEDKDILETKVISLEVIENTLDDNFNSFSLFKYIRLRKFKTNILYEEGYLPCSLFKDFNNEIAASSIIKYIESDCNISLTHDHKELSPIIIQPNHLINEYYDRDIKVSILVKHSVYANDTLVQISYQIKEDSSISIVTSK